METPQSMMHHTPDQQQYVQTPQQQESLASHFNLYHSVEKLSEATETGTRDHNSDALYVDDQKGKLEETEQLLQQRKELIEQYKKSLEEIVKKEP
ncbi:PREDICTED: mediator of RNA polymerase II transcription subunit 9-like [Camelina sativa]|uniref:Mediator of RNA polymerase II transcription subunit 9-like n=1 Tax=Camelina sativa TaxID=90675 RepID=A0ABM1R636_CAMSA|nr:PREDICTED: mediator of RNA polymerase II transcription subunit 9-like [Camelina sativa]